MLLQGKIGVALVLSVTLAPASTFPFTVTDGTITQSGGQWQVSTAELPLLTAARGANLITNFIYRGPTAVVSKLSDSEVRHQLGLVLRDQDVCNRVYIMWHFDTNQIFVQIKRNEGQSTHAGCLDNGYATVRSGEVPPIEINHPSYMSAKITGRNLAVTAGGKTVVVELPSEAFLFNGPAGFRSDNVLISFSYETE